MARHVHPTKILIVDLGPGGRGHARIDRYEQLGAELLVCYGNPKPKHLAWLCDGMRSVYTAEGTYGDQLPYIAATRGVRVVVHANPELWTERARDATTTVVVPTSWELHRIPAASVMPMPVARDRLPYRLRDQGRVFWHPAAPAMADRNGTNLVLAALEHVVGRCTVRLTGHGDQTGRRYCISDVTVEIAGGRDNYWDGYDDADVLLLPRRYGGLSLPVQEALSAGLPVVMLDTGPYAGHGGVVTVPTTGATDMPMKGGVFAVHDTDPRALAWQITELIAEPQLVQRLSRAADDTAADLCWTRWEAPWRQLLDQ